MANSDYPGPCWSCIKGECSVPERDFISAEDKREGNAQSEFGNALTYGHMKTQNEEFEL